MTVKVDTRGEKVSDHFWSDAEGFAMPLPPATGPRRIPLGDFPTGPEVGTRLPDVVAVHSQGRAVDLHADREGRPAVLVFTRSAVW